MVNGESKCDRKRHDLWLEGLELSCYGGSTKQKWLPYYISVCRDGHASGAVREVAQSNAVKRKRSRILHPLTIHEVRVALQNRRFRGSAVNSRPCRTTLCASSTAIGTTALQYRSSPGCDLKEKTQTSALPSGGTGHFLVPVVSSGTIRPPVSNLPFPLREDEIVQSLIVCTAWSVFHARRHQHSLTHPYRMRWYGLADPSIILTHCFGAKQSARSARAAAVAAPMTSGSWMPPKRHTKPSSFAVRRPLIMILFYIQLSAVPPLQHYDRSPMYPALLFVLELTQQQIYLFIAAHLHGDSRGFMDGNF
ncbi:unnamed protein product [Hydatigera taeniaeformis]|uniref:PH domain-containing protein n=1 Tax=Hydatigena taeniaeformis TaxID=6205 RepID=A0A0R3WM41_HYDTA|nr:unnamed protein product [Hydatigera taeniaeformis]